MAYNEHIIGIHQPVWVRVEKELGGETLRHVVRATPGRIIFNRNIPQDLGFVKRFNEDGTPSDKFFGRKWRLGGGREKEAKGFEGGGGGKRPPRRTPAPVAPWRRSVS